MVESTHAVAPIDGTSSAVATADLSRAGAYVEASIAPNTRRAYRSALADFRDWCDGQRFSPLPAAPETVAAYLADLADQGRAPSTIGQRAAAIRWAHESAGHESPTTHKGVKATLAGIRREKGAAPKSQKTPATAERVLAMVAHADASTLKGKRDRALLLLGFAMAARRSELVALDLSDLELTQLGLLVTIRRSKGDQEAQGAQLAIPFGRSGETCPVKALSTWLEAGEISEGALFRAVTRHGRIGERLSAGAVAHLVKGYAKRAGFDPKEFAGHSLRSGFATSAAERGAALADLMRHTRHKSPAVALGYIRRASAFDGHPGSGLL